MSGGKLDFTEMELDVDLNADLDISPIILNHSGTADLNTSIKGAKDEPVAMMMLGDQKQPISANLTGDKERPVSAAFELLNLPRFSIADIKEILKPKIRLSFPGHRQLCVKFLGYEFFTICYGGEGQIIIEPYESKGTDKCDYPVCDVDVRPFPKPIEK